MSKRYRNDDSDEEELLKKLKCGMNIRKERNHIYFYENIDETTILQLNIYLKDFILENKILSLDVVLEEILPVYLHINSNGGQLLDAFSTVDLITSSKEVKIVSIVEGTAASAATLISVSCHYRQITKNSMMLIHELSSGGWGKYSEIETEMKNMTDMMKNLREIYIKNTTLTDEELLKILKKDRYWNAKKCLRKGLVDEII